MRAKTEVLCENEWVSLRKLTDVDNHIHGYVYSHETRCKGKIIAILPFRFIGDGDARKLEVLLRREVTPCWDRLRQITSSITGGFENSETYTAIHELWEEAGYKIAEADLIPLGYSFASKSSDTKYTLYSVDLSDVEKTGGAEGDGSELEKLAECYWADEDTIINTWDPQVSVMFLRLFRMLVDIKKDQLSKETDK